MCNAYAWLSLKARRAAAAAATVSDQVRSECKGGAKSRRHGQGAAAASLSKVSQEPNKRKRSGQQHYADSVDPIAPQSSSGKCNGKLGQQHGDEPRNNRLATPYRI